MARRQYQNQRRSSRPNRHWFGNVPAAFVTIPAASKVLLATFVLDNSGIDETILRWVGGVAVSSDQTAGSETQNGAVGACLVTDTAAAAGIASLPDPVTDVADDLWFFYQSFAQQMTFFSAVGVNADMATWYPFDQRGKRIMQQGQTLVVIGANAHATAGLNVAVNIRGLGMVRGTR